jgi:hypothetical protein
LEGLADFEFDREELDMLKPSLSTGARSRARAMYQSLDQEVLVFAMVSTVSIVSLILYVSYP